MWLGDARLDLGGESVWITLCVLTFVVGSLAVLMIVGIVTVELVKSSLKARRQRRNRRMPPKRGFEVLIKSEECAKERK